MHAHACAQELRARASHPRAHAHMDAPACTWSHAKPCTHDCSDQTQLGSLRFVVAPLQRRRAVALQRCSVACRTSHGARRMPLGACGMATCYGFAWRTCALDADALVGAAVGGGAGGGVGPAGGVQVTCIPRDVDSPAAWYPRAMLCGPRLESCATSGGLVDAGCARWPSATRCNTVYHADMHAGLIVAEACAA